MYWLLVCLAILGLSAVLGASRAHHDVLTKEFDLEPIAQKGGTQTLFSDPFELQGGQNVRIRLTAPVSNTWLYVEGDLINDDTGLVQTFASPVEYYSGRDSDGAWSEGNARPEIYLSAVPAGNYTMRLECQWEHFDRPMQLSVMVGQGYPRGGNLAIVLVLVTLLPLVSMVRRHAIDRMRWADSPYNPYGGS
jgi:hypothetical protein